MEATAGGNGSTDATVGKAAAGAHGAVDKMAGAAEDAVRRVKPAIDRVAQVAHQAVNKAADAAGPTADWLSETGGNLRKTQQKAAADATAYVSAHPWRSIGFAFAAGFVISRLMR